MPAPDLLTRNLEALSRRSPRLAERLSWPVDGSHVVTTPDGRVLYRRELSALPLALTPEDVARVLPTSDGPLLVFGAGLGELPAAWLDAGKGPVIAYERDPWLVRLMLARRDWTFDLTSGRLRLALGIDLLELTPEPGSATAVHPVLGTIYRNERILLEQRPAGPLAFIAEGGLFVADVSDALREHGYRVFTLDVRRLSREESTHAVRRARPALLVTINLVEGLSAFCEEEALPTIVWEIDPSLTRVGKARRSTRRTHVFTWRRGNVEQLEAAGYTSVEHLPLAANPSLRRPVELTAAQAERYRAGVSFVGASMADRASALRRAFLERWQKDRRGSEAEGTQVMDGILAEQARDFSRHLVPQLLEARSPRWTVPRSEPEPAQLLSELAAAARRLSYVAALAEHGVHVWGDAGWTLVRGVNYRGPAGHTTEVTMIYGASTINVDIGRLYQLDIVTMRVFDVIACGGFVLAERCDDLAACFRLGEEVESWSTLDELKDKVRHYLEHPEQARAIAGRGRAALLERHTIGQRVRHMVERLRR